MKKKLLYITNQQEYSLHSFIIIVFEKYLQKYLDVKIVYFTQYKSYFEQKGTKYIFPEMDKKNLLTALSREKIEPSSFDYIIIRNLDSILKDILKNRKKYNYKVGFRVSYPKRLDRYFGDKSADKNIILTNINRGLKTYFTDKLINQCDIFLPTSEIMKNELYPNVSIKSIVLPAGIDPDNIFVKDQITNKNITFIYEGTLDKLRDFEVVLQGFSKLQTKKWHLVISTLNVSYAKKLKKRYQNIKDNIEIKTIKNKKKLYKYIKKCDVGISLLPDIPLYNISTPVKIMDYYTNSLPVLMTNNSHNDKIFTDKIDALFCKFNADDICKKLEYIIDLEPKKLQDIGKKGQQRLLDIRNYKNISKELFKTLESL